MAAGGRSRSESSADESDFCSVTWHLFNWILKFPTRYFFFCGPAHTHTRDTGSRLSHAGWLPPPSPFLLEIKRQRARPDVAVVASTNLKSCPSVRGSWRRDTPRARSLAIKRVTLRTEQERETNSLCGGHLRSSHLPDLLLLLARRAEQCVPVYYAYRQARPREYTPESFRATRTHTLVVVQEYKFCGLSYPAQPRTTPPRSLE